MQRPADATVYEIAYAEAVRALSEQHGVIDSLRTRAGLLLSSAAVTTSFLAGQAIHDGRVGVFAWLALLDFTVVAALVIATLQPRRWELRTYPEETITAQLSADSDGSPTELYEALTMRLHRSLGANRAVLEQLAALLQVAGALLAVEVVVWILAIATIT